MELNTTNPHCFIYQTDESATADRLLIELLGGVRIEGLDRMRVTIKVTVINRRREQYPNNAELASLPIRHNLDLYNDTQLPVFHFTRKTHIIAIKCDRIQNVESCRHKKSQYANTDFFCDPVRIQT